MRICVITPYFFPHAGGVESYIEEQYTNLISSHPGISVDLICYNTNRQPRHEVLNGIHIYRVSCFEILPSQFAIPNYIELIKLLKFLKKKNGNYQLVNSHTRFFENSWWAPLVARFLNAKSFLTDHCGSTPSHSIFFVTFVSRIIDKYFIRKIFSFYDKVIAVNMTTFNFLSKQNIHVNAVVYPSIDFNFFKINTIRNTNVVITFASRLISDKGVVVFLESTKKLLEEFPQLKIYVAGVGPLSHLVEKNTSDRMEYLGKLSKEQMAELLKKTDIFIHPSSHNEGIPIVILEAAASGCAVVATNQGGTSEIITDNETGIFILPNKEDLIKNVSKLIRNENLRKSLAKKLFLRVKSEFSTTAQIDNLMKNVILPLVKTPSIQASR